MFYCIGEYVLLRAGRPCAFVYASHVCVRPSHIVFGFVNKNAPANNPLMDYLQGRVKRVATLYSSNCCQLNLVDRYHGHLL